MLLEQILIGSGLILLSLCLWLGWRQRRQQKCLAEQATRQTTYEQAVLTLSQRLDALQQINLSIMQQLHELRSLQEVVMPLSERISQLEQRDPNSLSFSQAAQLMRLGVSADDLAQSCGLTRAEAELISRLHEKSPSN